MSYMGLIKPIILDNLQKLFVSIFAQISRQSNETNDVFYVFVDFIVALMILFNHKKPFNKKTCLSVWLVLN